MRRNVLNFIIDAVTAVGILALVATGLLVRYVLPPGSGGGGGGGRGADSIWGLTRHEWGDVHFWIAAGMLVVLVVHVALHWQWVCVLVSRWAGGPRLPRPVARNFAGAGFVLAIAGLVGGFLWLASLNVHSAPASERGRGQARAALNMPETEQAAHESISRRGDGQGRGREGRRSRNSTP